MIILEKAKASQPKSTFEKGSSSRSVPPKTEFEPYDCGVRLPDFLADSQVRSDAMSLLMAKSGRWIQTELINSLNSVRK